MDLIRQLENISGPAHVVRDTDGHASLSDMRAVYHGRALAIVYPGSTDEVAAIVRACVQHQTPVVVQGGNTGLMGAATPDDSGRSVLLLLSRLKRIRQVDVDNDTITVEAGCILQAVQEAAEQAGRLFPLSLGAEGSCTIGGNLGTNAGGTEVLRYGNARDLTLGLEVVTAQGEIWHGLRGLRKDNTGYDLRNLFIGSEGTLGIITAATLKLYPRPSAFYTALLAFEQIENAVRFLSVARRAWAASLTGFEIMAGQALVQIAEVLSEEGMPESPLPQRWYALVEVSDYGSGEHVSQAFETTLGEGLESGDIADAWIAQNEDQRHAWWQLREQRISEAQRAVGGTIKHDISLPISAIPAFIGEMKTELEASYPDVRIVAFGHLGDGNLHYNISLPASSGGSVSAARKSEIQQRVHASTHAHGGSVSAEHGVGLAKRDILPQYKQAVEIQLMQRIKAALDPLDLLNPGKVLPATPRIDPIPDSHPRKPVQ
jgi:FAD/FMN-containing dehydrogenase